MKNRGTADNPPSRFQRLVYEPDPDAADDDAPSPRTEFFRDSSRSVISRNDSSDVGFEASLNPYRGCEHGCVYCYARPTHEYFGLSPGLDFETKIFVKEDAPELLRRELSSRRWKPQVLALSGVTDPYQPIEGKFRLTRRCLEVLRDFRNPVQIITKNHLVRRDVDLLGELSTFDAAAVYLSVTTLRREVHKVLEPRTCHPERRLEAIQELSEAGIPVGVLVAPVIPGLTDHELPKIIERAAEAGARRGGYVMLRLPGAVRQLFEGWLEEHFPDRKNKVLDRIRSLRAGQLNDTRFGHRMRGEGIFADQVAELFRIACSRAGLERKPFELSSRHFRNPKGQQLEFF